MSDPEPRRHESELAWTEVRGADRVRFLHALMTNDVLGLAAGEGNQNLLLTDKGKLQAACLLLVEEERILLGAHREAREGLLAGLDHYLVADDVELRALDLSTEWILGQAPASLAAPERPLAHHRIGEAIVVHHDLGATPGLLVLFEGSPPFELAALPRGEPAALEALRVAAGVPAWGHELGPSVFPQEVGLGGALHATKGCYLGQETMTRIATQGQVRWQLVGLELASPAAAGDALAHEGKEVGAITSAALLPATGRPVALARLRGEHATPGTPLVVRGAAGEQAATVAALPF
ncbi:MAG: glycine cleavage T C-terminal barrel domain-containing protein [Deltaproteobacteria bacterium]|nr:glycine cleavage T C-terminal barrel domain-containing protein [Deltaproteobacteria bacterium]